MYRGDGCGYTGRAVADSADMPTDDPAKDYCSGTRRLFAEGGPDRAVVGADEDEGLFRAGQLAEAPGDDQLL